MARAPAIPLLGRTLLRRLRADRRTRRRQFNPFGIIADSYFKQIGLTPSFALRQRKLVAISPATLLEYRHRNTDPTLYTSHHGPL